MRPILSSDKLCRRLFLCVLDLSSPFFPPFFCIRCVFFFFSRSLPPSLLLHIPSEGTKTFHKQCDLKFDKAFGGKKKNLSELYKCTLRFMGKRQQSVATTSWLNTYLVGFSIRYISQLLMQTQSRWLNQKRLTKSLSYSYAARYSWRKEESFRTVGPLSLN